MIDAFLRAILLARDEHFLRVTPMRRKETAHHRRIRSGSALGRQPIAKRLQPCLTSRLFHERLNLDPLYSARPELGHADYRMPIPGLMCGASTHPGGGVTGAPGHNAACEMIRDFRARRWIKGIFRIELRSSSQEGQRPGRAASRS